MVIEEMLAQQGCHRIKGRTHLWPHEGEAIRPVDVAQESQTTFSTTSDGASQGCYYRSPSNGYEWSPTPYWDYTSRSWVDNSGPFFNAYQANLDQDYNPGQSRFATLKGLVEEDQSLESVITHLKQQISALAGPSSRGSLDPLRKKGETKMNRGPTQGKVKNTYQPKQMGQRSGASRTQTHTHLVEVSNMVSTKVGDGKAYKPSEIWRSTRGRELVTAMKIPEDSRNFSPTSLNARWKAREDTMIVDSMDPLNPSGVDNSELPDMEPKQGGNYNFVMSIPTVVAWNCRGASSKSFFGHLRELL